MRTKFTLLLVATCCTVNMSIAQSAESGNYNNWNYSPTTVFGLVKLSNTSKRPYYKIVKQDNATYKVQRYNASGIVTSTTLIRFVNNKINTMITSSRWGEAYETTKFAATGPGEFTVTRKSTGENDFLPCKAAKYIYKNNQLAEIRYIGYNNALAENSNGVAIIKYKRYEDKNRYSLVKQMNFYNAEGLPVTSNEYDCHKVVYEYDDRANEISEAYFGVDDEALTSRFGGFKLKYTYNSDDLLTRSETIGVNDEITMNTNGIAITEYQYENGLTSSATRFNDKHNITRTSASGDGIARILYSYDDQGNEIERSFYDEYGNAMNGNNGYHMIRYKYNAQGMVVQMAYFDKNKSPFNNTDGIHRYEYVKDAKDNVVEIAFYDKSGEPVTDNTDRVYRRKYKYDEYGRRISTSYWKDASTKMARWNGYYENVVTYNNDGQITELIYLDDKGNLFKTTTGYSKEVRAYNKLASLAERKWYDGNTPVLVSDAMATGFHSIKYFDDDQGRTSSLQYFDTYGNPVNATIELDSENLECQKIQFYYQGNRIIEERLYKKDTTTPFKVIDCINNNYIALSGISKAYKNQ